MQPDRQSQYRGDRANSMIYTACGILAILGSSVREPRVSELGWPIRRYLYRRRCLMLFVIEVMEGMGAFLVGGCFFQCRGSSFQDRRSAMTDSTIAPPPNRRFSLSNVSWSWFMASRHEEGCYEKRVLIRFHVRKGLSNDDVGAARVIVFQEIRPGERWFRNRRFR